MSLQQFSQVDFFECIIAGEAQMPSHSIGGGAQRLWLMSEVRSFHMSPDHLPSISHLRSITQALAMLDAILCPEWEYRYYSFDSQWGDNEEMASMRNGCGDDWFLLFDGAGAAIKGFAHELAQGSTLPEHIQSQVPGSFSSFLNEPAFSMQHATFCYWRGVNEHSWSKVIGGPEDDGASEMLALLVSGPSGYIAWAESYYECAVSAEATAAIFSHKPLTDSIILALNPEAELATVYAEAAEIGYPVMV